jgi:hypothetical protein
MYATLIVINRSSIVMALAAVHGKSTGEEKYSLLFSFEFLLSEKKKRDHFISWSSRRELVLVPQKHAFIDLQITNATSCIFTAFPARTMFEQDVTK